MLAVALALIIVLLLAFANGANDNFKGVATLYGGGTATFKGALLWASVTTAAGSLTALFLAGGLLQAFSGKGLVPDDVVALQSYSLAVILAASLTVLLATRLGFPISTTHALTGALVGAGLLASPTGVDLTKLGAAFVTPLLVSPVLSLALAAGGYGVARLVAARTGFARESCACVGTEVAAATPDGAVGLRLAARVGTQAECDASFAGGTAGGVVAGPALDKLHYASAGVVCFARALNDTPKIAAALLAGSLVSPSFGLALVALLMVVGGLVGSRRIAETMAHKVTTLDPGQGLTANLVTGLLVIGASNLGMPVSTTHVSVGSITGIGAVTGGARWKTILQILLAWVTTLPAAAGLGALAFLVLKHAL